MLTLKGRNLLPLRELTVRDALLVVEREVRRLVLVEVMELLGVLLELVVREAVVRVLVVRVLVVREVGVRALVT